MIEDVTDDHLIVRVAQRDEKALEILYERYSVDIYRLAQILLGSQAKAETVLEETFWQTWCCAEDIVLEKMNVMTWLYKTTRHLAKKLLDCAVEETVENSLTT